jgi:guanine nucleotide-binding protein subunit alpha
MFNPTSDDILHARTRTTGVHELNFNIPGHGPCKVYDVGGERAERKKWIHIFDQTATVLVFVPIDSYDRFLYEDENKVSFYHV